MKAAFKFSLGSDIAPGQVTVGKFDGKHPSLAAATTTGKLVLHSPHQNSKYQDDARDITGAVRHLKINNRVTAMTGTDFPITEEEYIGKVAYTIPQVGYVTQLLKPPINYVIIAIVVGIMVVKQFIKKKNEKELSFTDPLNSEDPGTIEELSDIDKIEKDSEYSEHTVKAEKVEKLDDTDEPEVEELDDTDEPENIAKTSEIDEKLEGIEDSIKEEESEANPKKKEKEY